MLHVYLSQIAMCSVRTFHLYFSCNFTDIPSHCDPGHVFSLLWTESAQPEKKKRCSTPADGLFAFHHKPPHAALKNDSPLTLIFH